ncbi:MAG: 30S ribosomal protein S16 [Parcubacteria group bacterium GW2011_GWE2_37_8]|nr:MAG: 30S ribosomal protein S16 [Parcubacteria group bacterium GW2011_GWE2_37_8]
MFMLKIRLQRVGKRNDAKFRLVVIEHTGKPKSGSLETLGFYDPKTDERGFNAEKIKYWISKGAKASDTVHNMLIKNQIISGKKIAVHKIKKEKKK